MVPIYGASLHTPRPAKFNSHAGIRHHLNIGLSTRLFHLACTFVGPYCPCTNQSSSSAHSATLHPLKHNPTLRKHKPISQSQTLNKMFSWPNFPEPSSLHSYTNLTLRKSDPLPTHPETFALNANPTSVRPSSLLRKTEPLSFTLLQALRNPKYQLPD